MFCWSEPSTLSVTAIASRFTPLACRVASLDCACFCNCSAIAAVVLAITCCCCCNCWVYCWVACVARCITSLDSWRSALKSPCTSTGIFSPFASSMAQSLNCAIVPSILRSSCSSWSNACWATRSVINVSFAISILRYDFDNFSFYFRSLADKTILPVNGAVQHLRTVQQDRRFPGQLRLSVALPLPLLCNTSATHRLMNHRLSQGIR